MFRLQRHFLLASVGQLDPENPLTGTGPKQASKIQEIKQLPKVGPEQRQAFPLTSFFVFFKKTKSSFDSGVSDCFEIICNLSLIVTSFLIYNSRHLTHLKYIAETVGILGWIVSGSKPNDFIREIYNQGKQHADVVGF